MKLNIKEIYIKNIESKYNIENKDKFFTDFNQKEQCFWSFTQDLLKDNYPKEIYDDKLDRKYLTGYLYLFLQDEDTVGFTITEWFEYLNSKK